VATNAAAAAAAAAAHALSGRWTGTLDYRDYGNDSRTTLPAILQSDGKSFDWTFDDGPGKTVRSSESWNFDPYGQSLAVTGGGRTEIWRVVEARSANNGEMMTLVLEGEIFENGRMVIARKILTRESGRMRLTKMTRLAGEPFLMRQSYELRQ
jgi:hypothetical protein